MLKKLRSLLSYHLQAAAQSLHYLIRKPLTNLMTIIVIAITLTLPCLFWVFSNHLSQFTRGWQNSGHLSLYLQSSLTSVEQQTALAAVRNTQGIGQATLKSPEEGLAELKQQEGMQDIMRYLPENPLPAVIEVIPSLAIDSPIKLDKLSKELENVPQIEQIKTDMAWVKRLHVLSQFIINIAQALMLLLALAVIFIIGNTLRLAIHNRHEEIQVLKLIGATDSFIIRPFLYSGIWYGLAGAILAIFFVHLFIFSLSSAVNQLASVYEMHYSLTGMSIRQILMLLVFAIILGWIGACMSVKRQLSSIEPTN